MARRTTRVSPLRGQSVGAEIRKAGSRLCGKADERADEVAGNAALLFGKAVVEQTPASLIFEESSGTLKRAWSWSRTPSGGIQPGRLRDPVGDGYWLQPAPKGIVSKGRPLYLVNRTPYVGVVEYGGYPNPPKRGTRLPTGDYVIRSRGGYSLQAPRGMVRINARRWRRYVRQAAKLTT